MTTGSSTVAGLLARSASGQAGAGDALVERLADEIGREAARGDVEPGPLIEGLWRRLIGNARVSPAVRDRFLLAAAAAMRVAMTRRDGPIRLAGRSVDVAALDVALGRLERLDPRKARLAELRLLGGLAVEDAASVLGLSRAIADEQWRMTRAWLYRELGELAP